MGNIPITAAERSRAQASGDCSGFVHESVQSCHESVQRHPTSAMLITFGLGFGLGMLIGHVMGEPPRAQLGQMARMKNRMMDALSHAASRK